MSDIQAVIELIEKGHSNSDHRDGQRQINEAVAMLRKMQEDSHFHSGQRWELSQILECGLLYRDIEKVVKELKNERNGWVSVNKTPPPMDGSRFLARTGSDLYFARFISVSAEFMDDAGKIRQPFDWMPIV